MPPPRSEPFLTALAELRNRIACGDYGPQAHLAAADLAAQLGLSPTPMREALARLVGEGLLEERRGEGFFVRRLSARDVADLYQLSEAHLRVALLSSRAASATARARSGGDLDQPDPVQAASDLLTDWVREAGSSVLTRSYQHLQGQLAGVRRLEADLLPDVRAEYLELWQAREKPPRERLALTHRFCQRRMRLARRFADALESRSAAS